MWKRSPLSFLSCNHLLRGNGPFLPIFDKSQTVFLFSVLPTHIFQNFWTLLLRYSKFVNDYFKHLVMLATLIFFHLLGGTKSLIIIIYFSCQKVLFSLIFRSPLVKMLLINGQWFCPHKSFLNCFQRTFKWYFQTLISFPKKSFMKF